MRKQEKVTIAEKILLGLTVLFLAGVLTAFFTRGSSTAERWTVTTGYTAIEAHPTAQIDLNTASAEELQRLPGIGPVLAERIVTYRENVGRFRSTEELTEIDGIGQGILHGLEGMICVEDAA